MEQARFQAVIQAVDQASGPLKAIRAQVIALRQPLAGMEGGFRRAGMQLQELARVSGLHRIADAARSARGAFETLSAKVSGVLTPLGVLGGAGSVAGLLSIVKAASDAGSGLHDLYARLGAVTEAQRAMVSGFRYSAEQEGSNAESASAGLQRLNRVVSEARAGANPEAMQLFQKGKIKLTGPKGEKLSGVDLLPQIAALFEKNEDAGVRERMAKALMGKSGGDLINAVAAYNENLKRLKTFGKVLTAEDSDALDEFGDRWADLNMAILGVRNAIGAKLSPVLSPLLNDLAHWVAANRELIAGRVKAWVDDIAIAIGKWNLRETVADLRGLLDGVRQLVVSLGGWRTVMIGFTALLAGPWIAAIAGVVSALAGLGVAFLANPIAGAGLAAVAAAAYLVMQHWRPVKAFFEDLWRGIADAFTAAWASIRATVVDPLIVAAQRIAAAWQSLGPIIDRFRSMEGSGPRLPGEPTVPRRGGLNGGGRLENFPAIEPQRMGYAPGGAGRAGGGQVTVRFVNAPREMRVEPPRGGAQPVRVAVGYAFNKQPIFA